MSNMIGKKTNKVVLFGHFGENNFGDTILLVNSVQLLQSLNKSISVLSANPNNTRNNLLKNNISVDHVQILYSGRYGLSDPSSSGMHRFSWILKQIREIHNCDLILIGPGTILQDKTNRLFILFWYSRILIARIFGRDFGFLGIGVGVVDHWISKSIVKNIGKTALFTITRDQASKEVLLKKFDFNPKRVYALVDLSYLSSINCNKSLLKNEGLHVGINFRNLENKHFYGNKNRMEHYIRVILEFTKKLRTEFKIEKISFVTMCSEGGQSDLPIYDLINNEFKKFQLGNVDLVDTEQDISSLENKLEEMDFFVGTRFHSIVLSTKLLIPTLAIAYSEKVEYYMEQLECEYLSIPVDEIDLCEMVKRFDFILTNKINIQNKLSLKSMEQKQKALTYPIILDKLMSK